MLILQYPWSDEFGADDDDEFKTELEALADACLREAGLGACDGGDIGTGKLNVFCNVVDGQRACDCIVAALQAAGIDGAVIAFVDDDEADSADPRVLWPRHFVGTFSVL